MPQLQVFLVSATLSLFVYTASEDQKADKPLKIMWIEKQFRRLKKNLSPFKNFDLAKHDAYGLQLVRVRYPHLVNWAGRLN